MASVPLLRALCSASELVELGAIVSLPGAACQQPHSDIAAEADCLLLTCFVALQDVDEAMGPTRIWPGTHTQAFCEGAGVPELLAQAEASSFLCDSDGDYYRMLRPLLDHLPPCHRLPRLL